MARTADFFTGPAQPAELEKRLTAAYRSAISRAVAILMLAQAVFQVMDEPDSACSYGAIINMHSDDCELTLGLVPFDEDSASSGLKPPSSSSIQGGKLLLDYFLPLGPVWPMLCIHECVQFKCLSICGLSSKCTLKSFKVLK